MPDSKRKSKQDRKLVSRTQAYEVAYFAKRYGLRMPTARELIKKHGNSRKKLDAVMRAMASSEA